MTLDSIRIENYRSIVDLIFDLEDLADGTDTYGLIGINEVGKSTILKALALKDGLKNEAGETLPLAKDFNDPSKQVKIEYLYVLNEEDIVEVKNYLAAGIPTFDPTDIDFTEVKLIIAFDHVAPGTPIISAEIKGLPLENKDFIQVLEQTKTIMLTKAHSSIFWTAESRYLISQPINLATFAQQPEDTSIPLKNCFALAGMTSKESINARIALITDSTERELLKDELGKKVTEHIKKRWPNHPIVITFDISDGVINFHVHDSGARGKAKTADQRSDGFKQFVSFLLTVSAQNQNQELSNTILLLDEPETHLHPQAQLDLLNELIELTQSDKNNIIFFATHSNYMIDKVDLSRNYRITKDLDKGSGKESTRKKRLDTKTSSYASVTYEVFDIPSTDFHNELYEKLHYQYVNKDLADKDREYISNFDTGYLAREKGLPQKYPYRNNPNQATLPTLVRNGIHHPGGPGNNYTVKQLRDSIEILKSFI